MPEDSVDDLVLKDDADDPHFTTAARTHQRARVRQCPLWIRSVAMAHQLRTVSKNRLGQKLGRVDDPKILEALREAMRVQLEL